MNSPTGKQPQPPQKKSVSEQNLDLQEALRNAAAYIQQMNRIMWLMVQASGGKITVNESKVDPLWRMDKTRDPVTQELTFISSVTPPPTADQMDSLVNKLMATDKLIEEVQAELGLESWPPQYLAFQMRERLIPMGGKWVDATLARGGTQPTGNN